MGRPLEITVINGQEETVSVRLNKPAYAIFDSPIHNIYLLIIFIDFLFKVLG
jgi:hypothetical protein